MCLSLAQEEAIAGYHCSDWLHFMQELETKFSNAVLSDMKKL